MKRKNVLRRQMTDGCRTYFQMNLIQRLMYLRRLYDYDSIQHEEQKQVIDKQIINHLSTENKYYINKNNYQQLKIIGEKIKSALDLLQNPTDCSNARIILPTQYCGFGCIMHQINYCLIIGSESGRTVIIENEETKIYKFNVKWSEVFEPITNCSYTKHVKPFLPLNDYEEPGQIDRILYLKYRLYLHKEINVSRGFDVAPIEIKDSILKYTYNPILWFRGQLINYIWKENERIKKETNKILSEIRIECGPVVGIHVRRTDKTSEAKIHKLEAYMKWVNFWFDVHEAIFFTIIQNFLFLIFINESWEALTEILAVSQILARSQLLVCTYSSNVCRIIYELMQAIQGDVSKNAHSIDYLYGQYWNENEMESTTDYKPVHEYPVTPEDIWAEKGDIIVVKSAVHNDGLVRGRNLRLNTEGNFPIYLLKEYSRFKNFSIFANIK
ncbi:hypothetical protein Mgra_00007008 [Meloidogyne graminicola]|uniref:GT23 domain-containing protein n=1 Tax=Meloidogyne graminicola TaxID=189291 RepID=A0A8S9ZK09_9BILA|nr:hypothetical protein Mgra_00007008 [Meloidogyne graminicola]